MNSVEITRSPTGPQHRDRVRAHLNERGVRYTRARRLVVGALQRAGGPQSADDLHRGLRRSVPLSSLYRSLAVLDQAGVVQRLPGSKGTARYELAEWLAGHHHHLVCLECGTSRDVELTGRLEHTVAQLAARLGNGVDFTVSGHRLDIEGICGACRTR